MCRAIYIEKRKGAAGERLSAFRHWLKPAIAEFLGYGCARNNIASPKMAAYSLRNPFCSKNSTFASLWMPSNRVRKTLNSFRKAFIRVSKGLYSVRMHIVSATLAIRVTQLEIHRIQSHRSMVRSDSGRKTS